MSDDLKARAARIWLASTSAGGSITVLAALVVLAIMVKLIGRLACC